MTLRLPSPNGAPHPLLGVLLISAAVLLFAVLDSLSKYLSAFHSVVMLVWFRYAVHTLLLAGVLLPRRGLGLLRSKRPLLQGLRGLCLFATSMLFISGLRYLPLGEATAINFLAPLLVTVLAVPLLGERATRGQWVAVGAGFLGVLIIVRPGGGLMTPAMLFPLGSATCFGLYQLITRRIAGTDDAATTNLITGVIGTLGTSLLLPFFWETAPLGHILGMAALGVIGLSGHMLLTWAFLYASPVLLAPFSYGQILFAGLLGYLLFDHVPDAGALLGMAVIALSGLAVALRQRRQMGRE